MKEKEKKKRNSQYNAIKNTKVLQAQKLSCFLNIHGELSKVILSALPLQLQWECLMKSEILWNDVKTMFNQQIDIAFYNYVMKIIELQIKSLHITESQRAQKRKKSKICCQKFPITF